MWYIIVLKYVDYHKHYLNPRVVEADSYQDAMEKSIEDKLYEELTVVFGPFDEKPNKM